MFFTRGERGGVSQALFWKNEFDWLSGVVILPALPRRNDYISELLTLYKPSRALRSSCQMLLVVPKTKTKLYGKIWFYQRS